MIVSKHSRRVYKLQLYPTLKEEVIKLFMKYHKLVLILCKRSGPITFWPIFIPPAPSVISFPHRYCVKITLV